jgi:hypothetical protein
MRRLTIAALVLVVGTGMLPTGSASADHFPHTKCDPSGDSCVSVRKIDGRRMLRLGLLFRYFPKHEVCVKGPDGGRTCRNYRTRRMSTGIWGSSVDWRENYPFQGRGTYRVVWRAQGHAIGVLKFHVRGGA